jgi:hypothetical protein
MIFYCWIVLSLTLFGVSFYFYSCNGFYTSTVSSNKLTFFFFAQKQHDQHWCSTEYWGGRSLAGQLLVLAIILSGLSFHAAGLAARFLKLAFPSPVTFYKLQSHFTRPVDM